MWKSKFYFTYLLFHYDFIVAFFDKAIIIQKENKPTILNFFFEVWGFEI